MGIVGQGPVRMAVEMERAAMRLVPHPKGIVAQHQKLLAAFSVGIGQLQLVIISDPLESLFHRLPSTFVIAANQADRAMELCANGTGLIDLFIEEDVAEVINDIAGCDRLVPANDQIGIHLLHRRVGPSVVADDIRMAEVVVGRKPNILHENRLF